MNQYIDIDKLMAKTWLMVTQLKYGRYDHDSESLYDTCCQQIDVVKSALGQTKLAPENIEHIIYAQCALLDKTAMELLARGDEEGDAFYAWRVAPLQARYFSSLDAGEALWDRIRSVLGQAQPNDAVLTCFHRVLMLGFSAHEATTEALSPERKLLMDKLTAQISPPESTLPLVIQYHQKSSLKLMRSFGFWSALLLIGITAITWGGQTWLNQLLSVV
ncbi:MULTISPECIES: type VI secretion system protein TssL, short form [Providencia]|uniref:Type VI secretion system protein TssL, short form n=1 Tax=Providencia stuartii TaxID=588 RepID=A0AAI9MV93_PROST|nr:MULTISPECIES: type VI secretion system protein TssL, short form [Providencia]ELR5043222.1 type VI secretion system protein TssL, short form [Providencia rettgeri]MCR4179620.1 type VI secretion system protein TssL, short form [Providencia vermicola]WBA55945.1 type VI secretion system protein TssL, short form [Providencia sp. 21OH12SH02B-Prov]ELR5035558.1 type VI secretion system protein TssL, short form [Providencia stuartii]ELR5291850.1 type VI secretion system protein TssL, short form [Pro